ncbi:MAG TPA: GNAT family N-acetyltransferase [Burkholderiales bacterium]|nr:GNAT family N-acetyltransferase [Burkholderiales bacterium]
MNVAEKDINLLVVDKLSDEQKQQLLCLYQNEWWSADRNLNDVKIIIKNSSFMVAYINKINNHLIAFGRVLTDNYIHAYLYDIIIHPGFRGIGLGKKLVNTILNHKKLSNIRNIELICRKELMPFYEQLGFSSDYKASIAMRKIKS